jgi:hypothetical protein
MTSEFPISHLKDARAPAFPFRGHGRRYTVAGGLCLFQFACRGGVVLNVMLQYSLQSSMVIACTASHERVASERGRVYGTE